MASLRGGQALWTAASLSNGAKSPLVAVGPGPYVSVYISSDTSATFTVEAAVDTTPNAGRNAFDSTADGGQAWAPYTTKEGHSVAIAVTGGVPIVYDLSPFGPQLFRLHITTLAGTAVVTASVSAFGPN